MSKRSRAIPTLSVEYIMNQNNSLKDRVRDLEAVISSLNTSFEKIKEERKNLLDEVQLFKKIVRKFAE